VSWVKKLEEQKVDKIFRQTAANIRQNCDTFWYSLHTMGAQTINFAFSLQQNGGFLALNFAILDKNSPTKKFATAFH